MAHPEEAERRSEVTREMEVDASSKSTHLQSIHSLIVILLLAVRIVVLCVTTDSF